MNNTIWMVLRYLNYFFSARHYGGHGIHSPFVYDFVINVLFKKDKSHSYNSIETYRRNLKNNKRVIEIKDLGAGSRVKKGNSRKIAEIAKTSSTKKKYAKLLARIVESYHPKLIVELGASLGISTCYLAENLLPDAELYTIEGDKNLFEMVSNCPLLKKHNIHIINETFEEVIPSLLNKIIGVDLVFFDGNHAKEATLSYFEQFLIKAHNETIFVFDDIHWSNEMEEAWDYICNHSKSKVCIDLFQFGIVFFGNELSKQNFIIRY